ncbi:hypothetical protein G6L46_30470 [Agrobacterium rhizogenes]|uniref:hypothetical protein n=1 Tax=Rhizobium rhizogenes TaxID=359 RepID=UPI00157481EA|nr:hypothetical protein [Rhizobium rhizogenes]NTF91494.1 hypothetical protein [Rhizobium rhizogenes]
MSLYQLIPDITGRMAYMADPSSRALVAFDGDGTTFKQDRSHPVWEINPASNIISNLTAIACRGHYQLLTSARQCEEIANSPFNAIPNIGFQGNDGTVTIFKGQRFEPIHAPNWQPIHGVMESEFGSISGIRNIPMEQFYGCQMWDSHQCYKRAGAILSSAISLIDDQSGREFKVVSSPEGHYLVPIQTPGKREGYLAFADRLPHKIGLHIACGNGTNDREMLTTVGNMKNGIAFWVGTAETKPPGTNVFAVPHEDALSAVLGELGELLPPRRIIERQHSYKV